MIEYLGFGVNTESLFPDFGNYALSLLSKYSCNETICKNLVSVLAKLLSSCKKEAKISNMTGVKQKLSTELFLEHGGVEIINNILKCQSLEKDVVFNCVIILYVISLNKGNT